MTGKQSLVKIMDGAIPTLSLPIDWLTWRASVLGYNLIRQVTPSRTGNEVSSGPRLAPVPQQLAFLKLKVELNPGVRVGD